ncbi:hypothetical protein [Larkinella knui]|uniref:Uncharacterized protein n=1 Tax=Larkinella knui TaxID=2025310 RepID=A0A3P1CDF8_9BACT|nr:hypothetical protein [Larkinella knui]RRB11361.1 hypothetical protein EHT87_23005 [Larkinella knui]
MNFLLKKPYLNSWLAIPIVLLTGLFSGQHTLTVQLYDTYFLIDSTYFVLAGSALLFITGVAYWLIRLNHKTPNYLLAVIHLLGTFIPLLLVVGPLYKNDPLGEPVGFLLSMSALLVSQFLFGASILIALFRQRTDRS